MKRCVEDHVDRKLTEPLVTSKSIHSSKVIREPALVTNGLHMLDERSMADSAVGG